MNILKVNCIVLVSQQTRLSHILNKTRKAWLPKTLTISQFVIAQVFIMATLVVSKQIHYSLNKDLGFIKDAIMVIIIVSLITLSVQTIKAAIANPVKSLRTE